MSPATWIILALILLAMFFAARYAWRKTKNGECVGCSGCKGGHGEHGCSCCHQAAPAAHDEK